MPLWTFYLLSSWLQLKLPVVTASRDSWWNSFMFCFWWWNCAFAVIQSDEKEKKTQRQRSSSFAYVRVRETARVRLKTVWVTGEAWATADKLVNKQTSQPPCSTITSSPRPRPPFSVCITPTSTVVLNRHLWLKLYINHTVPATHTHQTFIYPILIRHTCKARVRSELQLSPNLNKYGSNLFMLTLQQTPRAQLTN